MIAVARNFVTKKDQELFDLLCAGYIAITTTMFPLAAGCLQLKSALTTRVSFWLQFWLFWLYS